MSRVWWVNQSQSYNRERKAGIIYAGHDKEDPARARVKKICSGDIVVHNAKANVRSLSRVETNPRQRTPEVHDGPGDVADVKYFDVDEPIYFRDFAEEVYQLRIPDGPIQQNHDGTYGIRQGYCYAFSHKALLCLQERVSSWPSWQELRPENRYPTVAQEAVDVSLPEKKNEEKEEDSKLARTEQTVTRTIRDSQLARTVKEKSAYRCQVCGDLPIELPDGSLYAEAHHLKPLSEEGPDEEENIICVCPNCHVKLDYGTITLDHDVLTDESSSPVHPDFVKYHNQAAGRT